MLFISLQNEIKTCRRLQAVLAMFSMTLAGHMTYIRLADTGDSADKAIYLLQHMHM